MPSLPANKEAPDLSSVRTLITSVTKLAKACKVTNGAIYRWIKVNRIPGRFLTEVCNLYDIEIWELLPLTGSDKSNVTKVLHKPKNTLETLMQVYLGKMTLDEASASLNISTKSLHLIMFHWGDELPTLHTTLTQLDEKRISLDEAAKRLKVGKLSLHGIRKKYGYAPGVLKKTRPESQIKHRKALQREKALEVIAGKITAKQASEDLNMSYRTVFRAIEGITPHKLNELAHWPRAFRTALSLEIREKMPNYAKKWLDFAEKHRLVLEKYVKSPEKPTTWQKLPIKRLLVGVLMDEASLEAVAASRGGDPVVLEGIFDSELTPLGLTFEQAKALPIEHQIILCEVLLSTINRRRRPLDPNLGSINPKTTYSSEGNPHV